MNFVNCYTGLTFQNFIKTNGDLTNYAKIVLAIDKYPNMKNKIKVLEVANMIDSSFDKDPRGYYSTVFRSLAGADLIKYTRKDGWVITPAGKCYANNVKAAIK